MKISRNSASVVIAVSDAEYAAMHKTYPAAIGAQNELRASGEFTPSGFKLTFNKNGNGFYKSGNSTSDYRVQFTLVAAKAKTIGAFGMSEVTPTDTHNGSLLLKLPAQLKPLRNMRRAKRTAKSLTPPAQARPAQARSDVRAAAPTPPAIMGKSVAPRALTDAELLQLKARVNEAESTGFKVVLADDGSIAYFERRV
jgi:hypothetical protein